MKNEDIRKDLRKNDNPMNLMALQCLLDYGKMNILNDDFYNYLIARVKNKYDEGKKIPLVTKDYAIEVIKNSRKMAYLDNKDLYEFIQKDLIITQEIQEENDYPDEDYDY